MPYYEQIASGTTLDGIRALDGPDVAGHFREGDWSMLEMNFSAVPAADTISWMAEQLRSAAQAMGFNDFASSYRVEGDVATVRIHAQYTAVPLWAGVAVVLGLLIVLIWMIDWKLFQRIEDAFNAIGSAIEDAFGQTKGLGWFIL